MNQNIKEDICDLIATITPSEKTVKTFTPKVKSDGNSATLIDLIQAPLIFKSIISPQESANPTLQLIYLLGKELQDDWYELKNAYLTQIKTEVSAMHPQQSPFIRHILFEIELCFNLQDNPEEWENIIEQADEQRYELGQKCLDKLEKYIDNAFRLHHNSDLIRYWFETILITDADILKEGRLENFIDQNRLELKNELED